MYILQGRRDLERLKLVHAIALKVLVSCFVTRNSDDPVYIIYFIEYYSSSQRTDTSPRWWPQATSGIPAPQYIRTLQHYNDQYYVYQLTSWPASRLRTPDPGSSPEGRRTRNGRTCAWVYCLCARLVLGHWSDRRLGGRWLVGAKRLPGSCPCPTLVVWLSVCLLVCTPSPIQNIYSISIMTNTKLW